MVIRVATSFGIVPADLVAEDTKSNLNQGKNENGKTKLGMCAVIVAVIDLDDNEACNEQDHSENLCQNR